MKFITTTSPKAGKLLFVFPSSITFEAMLSAMNTIRHGSSTNWYREKKLIVDSGDFVVERVVTDAKYIETNSEERGTQIFVFSRLIDHDRMSEAIHNIEEDVNGVVDYFFREPVSAGFTDARHGTYGRSETLDLDSNPDAIKLLDAM